MVINMIIGLTGSMAAGKSTVSRMLEEKGFFIVDADRTAHEVLRKADVISRLATAFGYDVIGSDGEIDRRTLAARAFSTEDGVKRLNGITHPAIYNSMLESAQAAGNGFPAVVFDAPLLIESGLHRVCDKVWLVCANIETRYARIMERDGLTRTEARQRVKNQLPQWRKKPYADVIIDNDGDIETLRQNVDAAIAGLALRSKGSITNNSNN